MEPAHQDRRRESAREPRITLLWRQHGWQVENRIKEQQLDLFADRTSTQTMRANQIRLYFSSFAYVLLCALRRLGLTGTELARAQCGSIRLKLLKIGAQVRISVRRVWLSFSESYPYAELFRQVLQNLRAPPTVAGMA